MTKRIISILVVLTMLLTACSETSEPENTTVEPNGEIFDLPEESVPVESGGDAQASVGADDPTDEAISGQTNNDGTEPDEPIVEGPTNNDNDPSSNESETPTSSSAVEPTETQIADKRVYEDYLAAMTLIALSMEYFDFQLQGIYSTDKVFFDNKLDSKGIYAMFESGGSSYTAYVYPIEAERTDPGTMDIYTAELGYAAFDIVSGADDNYTEISQELYVDLISELTNVQIYMH